MGEVFVGSVLRMLRWVRLLDKQKLCSTLNPYHVLYSIRSQSWFYRFYYKNHNMIYYQLFMKAVLSDGNNKW